jgi:hypothetical protein
VRVPHVARDPAELRAERGRGLIQRVRQLEKGVSKITHHERRAYPIWCAVCCLPDVEARAGGRTVHVAREQASVWRARELEELTQALACSNVVVPNPTC